MAIKRTILTTVVALVLIAFVIAPTIASSSSGNASDSQPANPSNTAIGTPTPRPPPTLNLTGPSDVSVNETFMLNATLKEANGDARPNTLVTFTVGGATVGNATTDASGVASFSRSDPTAHAVTYVARVDDAGSTYTSNSVTVTFHAPSATPSPSPSAQPTSSPSVSPPVVNAEQSNNTTAAKSLKERSLVSSAKGSDAQGTNGLVSVELKNCTVTLVEPMSTPTASQKSLICAPTWLAPTVPSSVLAQAAAMSAEASALSQGGSAPTSCVTPATSLPSITLPAAQTNGAASLPAQSVFEFSLLGAGAPMLLIGVLYLLLRRV